MRRNQGDACAALRGEPSRLLLDDEQPEGDDAVVGEGEGSAEHRNAREATDVYEPQTPAEIQEVALVRIEQYERALKQAKEQFKGAGGVLQEEVEAAEARKEQER
jgi:hypothetical protein